MQVNIFTKLKNRWFANEPLSSRAQSLPADAICLEDRVLYSAVPFAVPAEPVDWSDSSELAQFSLNPEALQQLELVQPADPAIGIFFDETLIEDAAAVSEHSSSDPVADQVGNLIFINYDVDNIDQFISDVADLGPDYQVFVLDNQSAGVDQITNVLGSYSNLASVHLISHGSGGQVNLGNATLSLAALGDYENQLASWGSHLSEDADILFYGCNLAATEDGQRLIESLAQLTEADIAASDDLTGHDSLGGDWELEYANGDVEATVVVSTDLQNMWQSQLAVFVVTSTADDGSAGTLRWAIDQANINAGFDEIHFDITDGSAGQYYYQDDGVANSVSSTQIAAVPTGGESAVADFDPDHAYSWFQIDLDNSLPQLTIVDAVLIDGYSQWGASQNTQDVGQNAVLRIELTNSVIADGKRGISFDTGANGSSLQGLVVNGFEGVGVMIDYDVHNITLQGNYIGTDISGTLDFGNGDAGIQVRSNDNLIGGSSLADRNIVSGSNNRGIAFFSFGTLTGNVVENNYVGVDATGLVGLGNDAYGIQLYNTDGAQIINNVIGDNEFEGIRFRAGGNVVNSLIQGNMIGIAADGISLIGNGADGILVESNAATGNLIGGSGVGEGNVIGGNAGHGIAFNGTGISDNFVLNNSIGTDASWVLNLGNGGSGILISGGAYKQTIGGTSPGEANAIAFNSLDGVAVLSGVGNAIRGNMFHANGDLAIDLVGNNGVNINDAADGDGGPNNLQNYPVLVDAVVSGMDITINATLNSNPGTTGIVVDFYWSLSGNFSGHGEAENYIGSVLANTDGAGNATINQTFVGANVPVGAMVTATATDPALNTSEFSANILSTTANTAPVLSTNQLTLSEDETIILSSANLNATDTTDPDAGLTFNVSNVLGGHFAMTLAPTTPITSFTKAQVDAGDILFVDNGDEFAPSYDVEVTDGYLSDGPSVGTINFTNVNDPPVITSNGGGATASIDVAEGISTATTVTTVTATDVDDFPLSFAINGGNDAALFTINAFTGQLFFNAAPDFETPTDVDGDNVYEVIVQASDAASLSDTQLIDINIQPINDNAPVFTTPDTVNIDEGEVFAQTVNATDADAPGDTVTYSIVGGNDGTLFAIDPSTGDLTFIVAPDFETAVDSDFNNSYEVTVGASDGGSPATNQTILVIVDPVNEADPVFTSPTTATTAENSTPTSPLAQRMTIIQLTSLTRCQQIRSRTTVYFR